MMDLPFASLKPGMVVDYHGGTGRIKEKVQPDTLVMIDVTGTDKSFTASNEEPDIVRWSGVVTARVLQGDALDQVHPMLAQTLDTTKDAKKFEKLMNDPHWGLEEKYDGERQILLFQPGQNALSLRATTRVIGKNTGRLGENQGKLGHLLRNVVLPMDGPTVFDCELMHTGGFQALRSIMGSLDEKAVKMQETDKGHVHAVLFDALWFNGRDLRQLAYQVRREILMSWWMEVTEFLQSTGNIEHYTYFKELFKVSDLTLDPQHKHERLNRLLAEGKEGAMLKYMLAPYINTEFSGQRSPNVLKVKPFFTDEFVILGFERGKGKYNTGEFGAIKLAQLIPTPQVTPEMVKNAVRDNEIVRDMSLRAGAKPPHREAHVWVPMGSCGGFTKKQGAEFVANPDAFIGKAVEVKYQLRWSETGLMRHPNFVRMRSDKDPFDCVFDPTNAAGIQAGSGDSV